VKSIFQLVQQVVDSRISLVALIQKRRGEILWITMKFILASPIGNFLRRFWPRIAKSFARRGWKSCFDKRATADLTAIMV
jgi:hypothetical protein